MKQTPLFHDDARNETGIVNPRPDEGDGDLSGSPRVLMIGHSKHSWDTFTRLLSSHGVEVLVDVRTYPQSRFSPWFNKKSMGPSLAAVSVEYLHIEALGGKQPRPIAEQRETLFHLVPIFRDKVTCLMCSEKDYHQCHRHYTLAPLVIDLGFPVFQIQSDSSLVEDSGPTPELLRKMSAFLPDPETPPRAR